MRRYHVAVGGQTHVIDVNELSAHRFQVRVGEQQFEVDLSAAEDVAETVISPDMADSTEPTPLSAARFRPAAPDTLRTMVPAAPPPIAPSPLRASRGDVCAPMPGTIVSVDVHEGEMVTAGQVLVKLEAMKMVNAVKSPRDGKVALVPVQPGQSVTFGQTLVAFVEE